MKKQIEPYKVWDKFFECECHGEGIMVCAEFYRGLYDVPQITLAYWSEGYGRLPMGLKAKLRFIWRVLKTGRPWNDMVYLDVPTAKALGEYLIKFSKESENKE